jgi:cell shape-determining protein MreC
VKTKIIIGVLVILGIIVTGMVYAYGYRGQYAMKNCQNIDIEKFKKFQSETLNLRDELAIKRLELRNECLKQDLDDNRIETLKKEIRELRIKIREIADKYEVSPTCLKWRGKMACGKHVIPNDE